MFKIVAWDAAPELMTTIITEAEFLIYKKVNYWPILTNYARPLDILSKISTINICIKTWNALHVVAKIVINTKLSSSQYNKHC